MDKLGRSSVEAYGGIINGIIVAVLPMTWWLRCLLLLVVGALITDLSFRSPLTVKLHGVMRAFVCLLGIAVLVGLSWQPIRE